MKGATVLEFIAGAASVAVGVSIGFGFAVLTDRDDDDEPGGEPEPEDDPTAPPKPICGCKHHHAFHSEGKKCKALVTVADHWNDDRQADHWRERECPCPGYSGPEPIPTLLNH